MLKLALSLSIILVITVNSTSSQEQFTEEQLGEVYHCLQRETYGNNEVRTADYWQFHPVEGGISETYIVERYLGQPFSCSRAIVDSERNAVIYLQGTVATYQHASEFNINTDCWGALTGEGIDEYINEELLRTSYHVEKLSNNILTTIDYPDEFLLAPTYVGSFPQLVEAPLVPYDGQGFTVEIPVRELLENRNIDLVSGRFDSNTLSLLIQFYLDGMPGLQIAEQHPNYPENPFLLPGSRDVYLSLENSISETLQMEFHLTRNAEFLRITVSLPPRARDVSRLTDVIEGSSQPLATIASLFDGWVGSEQGPAATFLDGDVETYLLENSLELWLLDLDISELPYNVLYNRRVPRNSCEPQTFLPSWASEE